MKMLCVNAGSSSLKFQLFEMPEEKVIISGYIEKIGLKDSNSDVNTEIVKKGLLTKNNEHYPAEIVEKLPVGVINELAAEICEVSGIQQNEQDNTKLIKEMMGF